MRAKSSSQMWGLVVLIWNIKWMYILLNDCDINILFGLSTRVICFCPYRAIFNLCVPLTQGVASLCPGLCAGCPFRAFPYSREPESFLAAEIYGVALLQKSMALPCCRNLWRCLAAEIYVFLLQKSMALPCSEILGVNIKIPHCNIPPQGHLYTLPWRAQSREDWRR